jgi:hypothetical protein
MGSEGSVGVAKKRRGWKRSRRLAGLYADTMARRKPVRKIEASIGGIIKRMKSRAPFAVAAEVMVPSPHSGFVEAHEFFDSRLLLIARNNNTQLQPHSQRRRSQSDYNFESSSTQYVLRQALRLHRESTHTHFCPTASHSHTHICPLFLSQTFPARKSTSKRLDMQILTI